MNNHIVDVIIRNHRLSPAEAEIWITVIPASQAANTEIGGCLRGPRCPYISTVEIPYYLQPLLRHVANAPGLTRRVCIPEPNLWTPETPFLYEGFVKLLQDGIASKPWTVRHGLRALQVHSPGLRLNGKPCVLHGLWRSSFSEQEALRFRQAGFNTVVCPLAETTADLWELADRLGLLMIGVIANEPTALALALRHSWHPSCCGWLLSEEFANQDWTADSPLGKLCLEKVFLGLHLKQKRDPLPSWAAFVACHSPLAQEMPNLALPKLVLLGPGMETPTPPCLGTVIEGGDR